MRLIPTTTQLGTRPSYGPGPFQATVTLEKQPEGSDFEFFLQTTNPADPETELIQAYHTCHRNPERVLFLIKTGQRTNCQLQDQYDNLPSFLPEPLKRIAWWKHLNDYKNPEEPWKIGPHHTLYRTPAGCYLCEAFELAGVPYTLVEEPLQPRANACLERQAALTQIAYTQRTVDPKKKFSWETKIAISGKELVARKSQLFPTLNQQERTLTPKDKEDTFRRLIQETIQWGRTAKSGNDLKPKALKILEELVPHAYSSDFPEKLQWWIEEVDAPIAQKALAGYRLTCFQLREFLDQPLSILYERHLPQNAYPSFRGNPNHSPGEISLSNRILSKEKEALSKFLKRRTRTQILGSLFETEDGIDTYARLLSSGVIPLTEVFPSNDTQTWFGIQDLACWWKMQLPLSQRNTDGMPYQKWHQEKQGNKSGAQSPFSKKQQEDGLTRLNILLPNLIHYEEYGGTDPDIKAFVKQMISLAATWI
jgi:hypothetical protein